MPCRGNQPGRENNPYAPDGFGKSSLVCAAGIHGRESVNPVLLLRIIEDYTAAFRFHRKIQGFDVEKLLRQYSICFIPLVNPDGYEIASAGFDAIRNPIYRRMARDRKIPHERWKYNARGVDINRNFPCRSYVRRQFYEYPGSESETQTLIRYFGIMRQRPFWISIRAAE